MSGQRRIPAVFMRGGTSKGLFFHARDLPDDRAARDMIFCAALGSPDPNGRQLDGMGGGISSLSKVVVAQPSARADADIDYSFGQVAVDRPLVDYRSNCGNLTSAVGPFAVDEGLVQAADGEAMLTLYNTNTDKLVEARFRVAGGVAVPSGDFELQGVAGRGAPIALGFRDPGGAVTGKLLPTGRSADVLEVPGVGPVAASLVDATAAAVFVAAQAIGLAGTELPDQIEADTGLLQRLEAIRVAAARAMGLPETAESVPKIGVVAPPAAARTLAGKALAADAMDLNARMISMGRPHRALPLTGAMCLAVAARLGGTTAAGALAGPAPADRRLRIAHPSGVLELNAALSEDDGPRAERVEVVRTARRLMEGRVLVPETP